MTTTLQKPAQQTRPRVPKNIIKIKAADGRVLLVNPATRAWTITNRTGLVILELCNGKNSFQEIIETIETHKNNKNTVLNCLKELMERGVLENASPAQDSLPLSPCGCDGPGSLHLEITNRCNLACKHCYVSAGKIKPNELTLQEIHQVVDDFKKTIPPSSQGAIAITGGEARLRPDCLDVISYCRSHNFKTVLFTDAVGMPDTFAQNLQDLGCYVQVSLDGPDAESNDPIRGRGTFGRITKGIDVMLNHDLAQTMTLFVTLTRRSISRAMELVQYADERKISTIHFSQLNPQGRAKGNWTEVAPATDQWIRFGEEFLALRTRHVHVKGNVFGGLSMDADSFPMMRCQIPSSPRIDCQGNVYPCQLFMADEYRIGNIRENSLCEILKNERTREIAISAAQRPQTIERCRSCQWNDLCYSGCPAHAHSEFGLLEHEDSLCDVRLYWFNRVANQLLEA